MPPLFVRFFVDDWHVLLPGPWVQIAVVLVSVACGSIVGSERERREKPAGLRTLMLVCLGSTLFTMAGYAFTSSTGDSGRVAAQIVTGIGFLGAGVILHGRATISGTTTAATIWVAAAIGMVAATGYAGAALGVSILIRFLLSAARRFEVHRFGGLAAVDVAIEFAPDGGKTRVRIERVLMDYGSGAIIPHWSTLGEQRQRLTLQLHLPQHHLRELLGELAEIPEILTIQQEDRGDTKPAASTILKFTEP
ncbi:MAG: MgtC/SapB family protein [Chthoniobacter sp.]|uniref:MgtC/SapB family protein n=1 Tax=Chthoniobacter sp. TaxID=2510640 RepID=UPI0032A1DF16